MKKILIMLLSMIMILSCFNSVLALDGEYEITADKTSQWTMQQKETGYDLRIHGWKEWETAAYMGFTLPENFTGNNLVSAKLVIYTVSANKEGTAYLYSADYNDFENSMQYEGMADIPSYDSAEIMSFKSPTSKGDFEIDITNYIRDLDNDIKNLAFRIDVKSQNTNNKWIIGSCNNGYQAPKLILRYDDPSIIKRDVIVNAVYGEEVLATYTDKIVSEEKYKLTNEQVRYIRKNNDIYYLPYETKLEYETGTGNENIIINLQFEKLTDNGLIFFEDFSVKSLDELSNRGFYASVGAEIVNKAIKISDEGTLTLPDTVTANSYSVSCDFTANSESSFTLKDKNEEICSFIYNADTERHKLNVTIEKESVTVTIDNTRILSEQTNAKSVKSLILSGSLVIDNLMITVKEPNYGIVKNERFLHGTDGWKVTEDTYITDDLSDTFMVMKQSSAISQKIENIPCGKYDVVATVKSDSMANMAYVYAKADGHPMMKTSVSVTTHLGDHQWRDICIRGVNIDKGNCEIGIVLNELSKDEVRVYPHIPDEPLPDGNGSIKVKSVKLVSGENSNDTFLVGGDINFLTFLEDKGVQYFDEKGIEKDALQIMAENGANIVRLRLYNDPGKGHGDGVDYLPEGYQNPEDILNLAKRAKEKGMQIQLTFHYSDYWTNAQTQLIPHQWQEKINALSTQKEKTDELKNLLYNFTKDFMEKMKSQETLPEYVSFGNEMHTGLLFDKNQSYASANDFATLAEFLNIAYDAVKEVSPETKVILHLDGGGDKNKYYRFFNNCKTYGVKYDVIGTSYYPYWTQLDVETIVDFCSYLVKTFDKDIIIMETGYSFVDKNKIGGEDTRFTNNGPYTDTFGMTKMGQKAFLEELYNGLKQTLDGRCLGDLYWDPIMIKHEGVGWAYKESDDTIEHNKNIAITLFDTDGYKLPAQKVFKDNGYITDTVTIFGKISGEKVDNTVELNINGKIYKTVADRFGYYVKRIPYADTISVSAAGAQESEYILDMTSENVKGEVNFSFNSPSIADIVANIDDGKITYNVEYNKVSENSKLYVALYDSDKRLIACSTANQGIFAVSDNSIDYTIKAFLLEDMKPVCTSKEYSIKYTVYGE